MRISAGLVGGIIEGQSDTESFSGISLAYEYIQLINSIHQTYWGIGSDLSVGGPRTAILISTYNLHYKADMFGLFNRDYLFFDWVAGIGPRFVFSQKENDGLTFIPNVALKFGLTLNIKFPDGVYLETSALILAPIITEIYSYVANGVKSTVRFPLGIRWNF